MDDFSRGPHTRPQAAGTHLRDVWQQPCMTPLFDQFRVSSV
jgi:hypothetical protein